MMHWIGARLVHVVMCLMMITTIRTNVAIGFAVFLIILPIPAHLVLPRLDRIRQL